MGRDFVEQEYRGAAAALLRKLARVGKHDRDQKRLLLAGRAVSRIPTLAGVSGGQVPDVRPPGRPSRFSVA